MALIVLQTLWADGPLRCVLVKHVQPTVYVVEVFDGCRVLEAALVDDPEQAQHVAAQFRKQFLRSSSGTSSAIM